MKKSPFSAAKERRWSKMNMRRGAFWGIAMNSYRKLNLSFFNKILLFLLGGYPEMYYFCISKIDKLVK